MIQIWIYSLASVAVVSLLSLIGVLALVAQERTIQRTLFYLVSLSAGALLGDVFLHMLPEMGSRGLKTSDSFLILLGIFIFFVLERFISWHHSHTEHKEEVHAVVYLTLIGDSLHNFIDGVVIGSSFLISIPLGITTTLAVILHEVPHEFGNFAILVHGGWKAKKALLYNFLSSIPAIFGTVLVLLFAKKLLLAPNYLLAFAASSFIYIAMSDLIPEIHDKSKEYNSFIQMFGFILGIALMAILLLFE